MFGPHFCDTRTSSCQGPSCKCFWREIWQGCLFKSKLLLIQLSFTSRPFDVASSSFSSVEKGGFFIQYGTKNSVQQPDPSIQRGAITPYLYGCDAKQQQAVKTAWERRPGSSPRPIPSGRRQVGSTMDYTRKP
jgi:hypothetical protein